MSIKALLIGVSQYEEYQELPFCKNDLVIMKKSLEEGLNVLSSNITSIGLNNTIYLKDFQLILKETLYNLNEEDILILVVMVV